VAAWVATSHIQQVQSLPSRYVVSHYPRNSGDVVVALELDDIAEPNPEVDNEGAGDADVDDIGTVDAAIDDHIDCDDVDQLRFQCQKRCRSCIR